MFNLFKKDTNSEAVSPREQAARAKEKAAKEALDKKIKAELAAGKISVEIKYPHHLIVTADKAGVTINRQGIFDPNRGEIKVPYSSITAIKLSTFPCSLNIKTTSGRDLNGGAALTYGGVTVAEQTPDDTDIQFDSDQLTEMTALRDFIQRKLDDLQKGSKQTASLDPADEILKFKKLADQGIITQDEFEAKKKQLLGL